MRKQEKEKKMRRDGYVRIENKKDSEGNKLCPVCGGTHFAFCRWYNRESEDGPIYVFEICARCDMKTQDEDYFNKVVETLDGLMEEAKE